MNSTVKQMTDSERFRVCWNVWDKMKGRKMADLKNIVPMDNEEDYLGHMFWLQREMQKFNHKKRPEIVHPQADYDKRIGAAIYYWNATCVEYSEMLGADNDEDRHEELVDMLHFIMAQLIYLDVDIEKFHRNYKMFFDGPSLRDTGENLWSALSLEWADLIRTMPFKIWKTYEGSEMKLIHTELQTSHAEFFLQFFFDICKHYGLGKNELYFGYINKNIENFKRQMPGGMYEK